LIDMVQSLRLGIFCPYDTYGYSHRATLQAEADLVVQAEALGFDEAWISEHHFDDGSSSPSIFPLLAHLAALTSRIRLGSAAVLLPFHSPIEVAEDVATIDLLSGGRFDFGVARGGPFPQQNRHFGVSAEESRPRMLEALRLIQRLLSEDCVDHQGRYFQVDRLWLTPRPLQQPVPTWIASSSDDAIRDAAAQGHGIMAGLTSSLHNIAQMLSRYRDGDPVADPRLAVSRFYCAAPSRDAALAEAVPYLQRFFDRRRRLSAGPDVAVPPVTIDGFVERSLIGSHAEVRAKLEALCAHDPRSLLIVPTSEDASRRIAMLTDFRAHVR
jgi:alkanesulfonate monooxygenase SsuD/methylene tetrahydromethanopterin reductase-like flavin-dependent oxidoreductase (luciferase family)